jgi:hypothetical protein
VGFEADALVCVEQSDLRIGHDGAGGVLDGTGDGAFIDLREGSVRWHKQKKQTRKG